MEILLTSIYAFLFSLVVYKNNFFHAQGISPHISVALFDLKVAAGIVLVLIYTYYYTDRSSGDIYKYFYDGKIIHNLLFTDPLSFFQIVFGVNTESGHIREILETTSHWYKPLESPLYNDNRTIIRFNALAHIVSFGSIGVHTVIMCFLSYTGLLAIYKTCADFLKGKEWELIFTIFMLPSVLFWGSGVLKEGILLFAMGSAMYSSRLLLEKSFSWKYLAVLLASLWLLCLSKIYVMLALLPSAVSYTWCYFSQNRRVPLKYAAVFILCLACVANLGWIIPDLDLFELMAQKQKDFMNLAMAWNAQSYYEIPMVEPNILSMVKAAPVAWFNVLVRPHILEAGNVMMLLAAIENLMILAIIILCIIFRKKHVNNRNFMFFCLGFVAVLYALIGMITPVLGAVVRYKVPALPFVVVICLLLLDKERLITRFPILKLLSNENK